MSAHDTIRCEDWRAVSPPVVRPLYAAEGARWRRLLDWDQSWTWETVERARAAGDLPGFVARDDTGRIIGWIFFFLDQGTLQIGAVLGQRGEVVERLIDAALDAPEAHSAARHGGFVFPQTDDVAQALARRGFAVHRFLYLARGLGDRPGAHTPGSVNVRRWGRNDLDPVARLLSRAYAGAPQAVCYAPTASASDWARYALGLVVGRGCGRFMPAATWVAEAAPSPIQGAVVTTSVGPGTAHIAQLIVEPRDHGLGVGRALLEVSCAAARNAGYRRMTLLVAETNQPARCLYANAGFLPTAEFLFAWR